MSIYGTIKKITSKTEISFDAGKVEPSVDINKFLLKSGGTMRGGLSIDDANLAINTRSGGPEIDIKQSSVNSEAQLPSGIRIRRPDDMAHFQLGWSKNNKLTLYNAQMNDYGATQTIVCEFTNRNITSLAEPKNPSDCATKQYVDSTRKGNDIYYNEQVTLSEEWEATTFPSNYNKPTITEITRTGKIIKLKKIGMYCVTVCGKKIEQDRRIDLRGSVVLKFNGERIDSSDIGQTMRYFDFSTIIPAKIDDELQVDVRKTTKEDLVMHITVLIQEL